MQFIDQCHPYTLWQTAHHIHCRASRTRGDRGSRGQVGCRGVGRGKNIGTTDKWCKTWCHVSITRSQQGSSLINVTHTLTGRPRATASHCRASRARRYTKKSDKEAQTVRCRGVGSRGGGVHQTWPLVSISIHQKVLVRFLGFLDQCYAYLGFRLWLHIGSKIFLGLVELSILCPNKTLSMDYQSVRDKKRASSVIPTWQPTPTPHRCYYLINIT